jgi:glycosyltransferase involved in cell wall biosynthesis
MSDGISIKKFIPYEPGNLAKAYNNSMKLLEEDEWALFLDHDALIMRPNWHEMCVHAIKTAKNPGWITGVANSIWCVDQLATCTSDSISEHIKFSNELYQKHGFSLTEESTPIRYLGNVFSGMFILTSKKAWRDVGGFEEEDKDVTHVWNGKETSFRCDRFLGVDNDYCLKLREKGYKTYVLKGLYIYHLREKKAAFEIELKNQGEEIKQKEKNTPPFPAVSSKRKDALNRKQRRHQEKLMKKEMAKLPTISAIMMAKNEDEYIDQCLSSVKPFVDEIILVDTGSTDNTNKIAQKYGAKIFNHPWEDSFCVGRNHSVSHATCDWLMQVDCDETIQGNPILLRKILQQIPEHINGVTVDMRDIQGGGVKTVFNSPRLFRRGTVHYEEIVHNKPKFGNTEAAHCPSQVLFFNHFGYDLSPEKKKAKIERSVGLLKKQLRLDPTHYGAYFYLMQMVGWDEQYEKSVEYAEIYLAKKKELGDQFNRSVYYSAFRHYLALNNPKRAGEWLSMGLGEMPDNLDLLLGLVELGSAIGNIDLITKGAKEYLIQYDQFPEKRAKMGTAMFIHSYQPEVAAFCATNLSNVYLQQGSKALQILDNILPKIDIRYREKLEEESGKALNAVGLKRL